MILRNVVELAALVVKLPPNTGIAFKEALLASL